MYNKRMDGPRNNLYPLGVDATLPEALRRAWEQVSISATTTRIIRGILDFQLNALPRSDLSANYAKSEVATGPYQSKSTVAVLDAKARSSM